MNILGVTEERISGPSPTVIKVIGTGGGGCNAVSRMIECGLGKVGFITVNTDLQALSRCNSDYRLQIGEKATRGLGAGGKPDMGETAAVESRDKIENMLKGADMVFVTAGMGGGTGTGSAPVIAQVARSCGALTVGVVTKPFEFEGKQKQKLAEEGILKLRETVDTLIVIPNQHLLKVCDRHLGMRDAFKKADEVLLQAVKGISDLITKGGELNIDFADVREFMNGRGDALMGIGTGSGEDRAKTAAQNALNNPMLEESSINGATHLLINVTSGENFSITEFQEVVNAIKENACEDAMIKTGWIVDNSMEDVISVTVIATGFKSKTAISIEEKQAGEEEKKKKSEKNEYLFTGSDFDNIAGQSQKTNTWTTDRANERETSEDYLEIPAYMRQKNNPYNLVDEVARRKQAG